MVTGTVGERLFDEKNERTGYLERVLNFLKEYQIQFQRTRAFCDKLKELELLEPVRADFTLPSGDRASLSGFMVVNRAKLKALDGDKLAELASSDALELAYLQMHSLNNLERMREVLGDAPAAGEEATASDAPDRAASEDGNASPDETNETAAPKRKAAATRKRK